MSLMSRLFGGSKAVPPAPPPPAPPPQQQPAGELPPWLRQTEAPPAPAPEPPPAPKPPPVVPTPGPEPVSAAPEPVTEPPVPAPEAAPAASDIAVPAAEAAPPPEGPPPAPDAEPMPDAAPATEAPAEPTAEAAPAPEPASAEAPAPAEPAMPPTTGEVLQAAALAAPAFTAVVSEPAPAPAPEPEPELVADVAPPRLNTQLDFSLLVTRDGAKELEMPLSAEWVASLVDSAPDQPDSESFFELAAEHPSTQVRQNVAYKDNLSEAALNRLADSPEYSVVERLIRSREFRNTVMPDRLFGLMDRHPELAQAVASDYESFLNCNAGELVRVLGAHRDPAVRKALLENYRSGPSILRRFLQDPDPGVRNVAQRRLHEG